MPNTDAKRFTPRAVALTMGLFALAGTGSCRCIEHPLYDAKVNRFDTWYLGGGNTQYRPFRSVQYDPDAAFALELRLRHEGSQVVVAATLLGEAVADLEGALTAQWSERDLAEEPMEHEELLASFEHVDDDLALAAIDRATIEALDRRGAALTIVFVDEIGATARLDLWPTDLLDPYRPVELAAREEVLP